MSIQFVDARTGATISRAKLHPDELPSRLDSSSTVNIDGIECCVVSADPRTVEEAVVKGAQTQVITADGPFWIAGPVLLDGTKQQILYSLPTVTDAWPKLLVGSTGVGKDVIELHEDDWRQVEFVSRVHQAHVETMFACIARVYEVSRDGVSFKETVMRKLRNPLGPADISFDTLRSRLKSSTLLDGVKLDNQTELVDGGFAFRSQSSFGLYGQSVFGKLTCLGLTKPKGPVDQGRDAVALSELALENNLLLVDWINATTLDPNRF